MSNRNYTGFTPGPMKFDDTGGGVTPEQEALINEIPDIKSDITDIETALENIDEFEPSNSGNSGQVLTKGNDGYGWETPSGGSDVGCLATTQIYPATLTVRTHDDILANNPETFNALLSIQTQIRTKDNQSQTIDSLKASAVFNKVPGSVLGYIANITLHLSGIYTLANYVNPMIINIVIRANPVTGDTTKIDLKYSGVAVFNKTFKDIQSFMIDIQSFDICGKEFEPENTGTLGDVLTKTATGYAWQTPSEYGPVQQSLTMNNDTLRETTNLTQGTLNNESESLSDSLSITTSVEVVE